MASLLQHEVEEVRSAASCVLCHQRMPLEAQLSLLPRVMTLMVCYSVNVQVGGFMLSS